jgi:hypothetical protein
MNDIAYYSFKLETVALEKMILIKKDQVDQIIFLKMAFIVKEPNLG